MPTSPPSTTIPGAIPWLKKGESLPGYDPVTNPYPLDRSNRALKWLLTNWGMDPDADPFPRLLDFVGYGYVNVKDPLYGATGDGVTNDRASILAAIAALPTVGGTLYFPYGIYNIGDVSGGNIFSLTGKSFLKVYADRAKIVCNTTINSLTNVFHMVDPSNVVFEGLYLDDTGADLTVSWRGANMFAFIDSAVDSGTITIKDCHSLHAVTFMVCYSSTDGLPGDFRIRGISVVDCSATDTYYGLNFQNNGDQVRFRNFRTDRCRRSYFPYGIQDHQGDITIHNAPGGIGATAAVLINRYLRDTSNIKLDVTFTGCATCLNAVNFAIQNDAFVGTMSDIEVNVHIAPDLTYDVAMQIFHFVGYNVAGTVQASTTQHWENIQIGGDLATYPYGTAVVIDSVQAVPGRLFINPSLFRDLYTSQQYPGFLVHSSLNEFFMTLYNDLPSKTMTVPLAKWNANTFCMKVKLYAHDKASSLSIQNASYQEYVLIGYNGGAGPVVLQSITNTVNTAQGTAITPTFTASGENLVISFAGTPYADATAYARVSFEMLGKY